MPPGGSKPSPTVMPAADMRMTKTMMAEMAAAEMTAAVTTPVATTVAATMTTTVATAALRQSPACGEHASQGHRDNSKDWSQHLTLP